MTKEKNPPLSPEIAAMMERFTHQLRSAGMKAPTKVGFFCDLSRRRRFYREMTELTAFIVNLRCVEDGVKVVYGYASTAFTRMKNDENALMENGVDDDDINIRQQIVIRSSADEAAAAQAIGAMYEAYRTVEKDELLQLAREKRKQWLQLFADRLKPLGFRKKGNMWTRQLEEGYLLRFEAQKSSYSDLYYFNLFIGRAEDTWCLGDCYYTRVSPTEEAAEDWQLLDEDVWVAFIDDVVENHLLPLINAPLSETGRRSDVWHHCHCSRDKCPTCWVEKNFWEATDAPLRPYERREGDKLAAWIGGQWVLLTQEQAAELTKVE